MAIITCPCCKGSKEMSFGLFEDYKRIQREKYNTIIAVDSMDCIVCDGKGKLEKSNIKPPSYYGFD